MTYWSSHIDTAKLTILLYRMLSHSDHVGNMVDALMLVHESGFTCTGRQMPYVCLHLSKLHCLLNCEMTAGCPEPLRHDLFECCNVMARRIESHISMSCELAVLSLQWSNASSVI